MENPSGQSDSRKMVEAICTSCRNTIDVTDLEPGQEITCPYCNYEFLLTRKFGNFLLERQLGSGGMGSVYLARDLTLNRVVAVKVLKSELVSDKKFMGTFLREAQITASLNHPNIVHVYTFGEHDGIYYLVIEYVAGGSLDEKIMQRGHISELEGIEIGIAVSRVLECALARGLIHRDIKPGNILFANNIPKVVDFGLSMSFETMNNFDGDIWGTPNYIPPEKLEKQPEDYRSDMYSLGATLFHALSGRPPYEGEDPNAVAMKHLSGKVVSLKSLVPEISDKMSYIVGKAMARYPEDRFESYAALIEHLENAKAHLANPNLQTRQIQNIQNAQSSRILEPTSNARMGLIAGLVSGAVVVIGIIGFFIWKGMSSPAPVPAATPPSPAAITQAVPTPQAIQQAPASSPSPSPSSPSIVSTPGPNFNGNYRIIGQGSGLPLAVQGDSKQMDANIALANAGGSDGSDLWEITRLNDGHYKILNKNSGMAMVLDHSRRQPGVNIVQHTFNNSAEKLKTSDEWIIEPTTNGYYKLTNAYMNAPYGDGAQAYPGLVLEVKGNATTADSHIDQAAWTGGENQQFKIVDADQSPALSPTPATEASKPSIEASKAPTVSTTPANFNTNGFSRIIAKNSGLCLTLPNNSLEEGANIIQAALDGSDPNNQWKISPLGNGHYRIVIKDTNRAIDVAHALTTAGTSIIEWDKSKKPKSKTGELKAKANELKNNEEWIIEPTTNGNYRFTNAYSGLVMEIKDSSTASGGTLDQAAWTGGDNQQFQIVSVP